MRRRTKKEIVWSLTDNRCVYCGDTPDKDEDRTVDHLIPASRGGNRSLKNLLPACRECNNSRGNKHFKFMRVCAEFREMVELMEDKMIRASDKKESKKRRRNEPPHKQE